MRTRPPAAPGMPLAPCPGRTGTRRPPPSCRPCAGAGIAGRSGRGRRPRTAGGRWCARRTCWSCRGGAVVSIGGKRLFISHLSISGLKCGGRARQRGGKGGRAVTAPIPIIAVEKALFLSIPFPFVPREEFASLSFSLSLLSRYLGDENSSTHSIR